MRKFGKGLELVPPYGRQTQEPFLIISLALFIWIESFFHSLFNFTFSFKTETDLFLGGASLSLVYSFIPLNRRGFLTQKIYKQSF